MQIQRPHNVLMLVAKTLNHEKTKNVLLLFGLILLIVSGSFACKGEKDLKPSYSNGSGFRLRLLNANQIISDSNWIHINIRDKNNDFIENGTQVIIGCEKIDVVNGQMSFLLRKIDVESIFKASSVGYYIVETEPLFLKENDSVVIEFVLAEDHRPLINCE